MHDGALSGTVDLDGSSVRIALTGEVDISSGEQLDVALTTLIRGGFTTIVVDLEGVRFVDCAGLRPLLRAAQTASAAGGVLRVERPRLLVQRVLRLTGTDHLLAGRRMRPR